VGFLAVTHVLINSGLRRITSSSFGVSNKIMNGEVNADIVICGSSRAVAHYDPRIIRVITGYKAFNIGRNGSQTDMQVAFLKAYLLHNKPPKLLVQNLDLFSFVTSREIYDPGQYMPYLGEEPIYSAIRRIYPDAWKWKLLPLYGYAVEDMRFDWLQTLWGWSGISLREDHFEGFQPNFSSWTGDFDKFRNSHLEGVAFGIEPRGVGDVEEIAEICRQRHMALLFVYSPEYHEIQTIEKNRREIFAKFQEIAARYHVPLWDYSSSPICRNRNLFYNSQHLNADGAATFSTDLAQRLRRAEFGGM